MPFAATLAAVETPSAATLIIAVALVAVLSRFNSGLYVASHALFELAAAGGRNPLPHATGKSSGLIFTLLLKTSGSVNMVVYGLITLA